MNTTPLISVIIPAYNSERTVERAVRSVLSQTYENVEVIVVDDGSRDGTASVVRSLMGENSRVRLLQKPNGGVSAARNDGIRMASGEWFVTLDADDYIDREMLRRLYETAEESGADTVMCGFRMVYDNGRKDVYRLEEDYVDDREEFIDAAFIPLYDRHMISTHSNKLYRTALVRREHIYYNERLAVNEDIDFVLRYLRHCRTIGVIRGVYLNYVQQETGKSLNTTFQHYGIASSLLVLRDCDALFSDLDLSDRVFDGMNNRLLLHICSFVGLMYYRSAYSDEKKMQEIRKLCEREEFRELLADTRPQGLKQMIAHFLLKHKMVREYHMLCKLLYRPLMGAAPAEDKSLDGAPDGYDLLDPPAEQEERAELSPVGTDTGRIDTGLVREAMEEEGKTAPGQPEQDLYSMTVEDMEELKKRLKMTEF